MSAQTGTLPDSFVHPSFLQPAADVGQPADVQQPADGRQDPSRMRTFKGKKEGENGLSMLPAMLWGKGCLILQICIREEKFWFLWLTLGKLMRLKTGEGQRDLNSKDFMSPFTQSTQHQQSQTSEVWCSEPQQKTLTHWAGGQERC